MRIGIDVTSTQDQFAHRGIGKYTKNIFEGLLKYSNHDIVIYKFDSPSSIDYFSQKREYQKRIEVVSLGKFKYSTPKNIFHKRSLEGLVKRSNIDVFFSPNIERGVILGKFKTVVMIHDVIPLIEKNFSSKGRVANIIKEKVYRKNLDDALKADLILTNSEFSKNHIKRYVKNKDINVVYLGVDERFFEIKWDRIVPVIEKYNLPNEYILFYGGNQKNKNVEKLIDVWNKFASKDEKMSSTIQLVLAGKDFSNKQSVENKRILSKIKEYNLYGRIFFLNNFMENDQAYILAGARCFINLSSLEGFGFPVLEASAVGVPVIASNIPVYKEILDDSCILVDLKNENEIVKNIKKVLKLTQDELKRIRKTEIDNARRFSWEKTVTQTLSLIESL